MDKDSKKNLVAKKKRTPNETNKIKNREKQTEILKIAWKFFLQYGYKKTSLQMIVKETGGSLATIYKLFKNKKTIFAKAISENGQDFIDSFDKDFNEIAPHSNLEEYFYHIGVKLINQILSQESIAFHRLIVVEGYNNPELIEIFHHNAVCKVHHFLLKILEDYNTAHNLGIEDIDESLHIFTELIIGSYFIDTIMIPNYVRPSADEIHRAAKRAIKIFMLYLKHYKEIK
ncbi:TetR/AcrR family transcriptional regulator [Helicobacter sp. MIT 11-5569]|uniref:TetR/AcrR family transcriptional regulator n=1 Tax=Helicobacter sp. MIT 11-5569 TaxID=1548151 RepID=UPI00069040F6|nr:TetR/AcrR family transcriptional regulator [Helicobacter sp. MIT 11-5569]TLD83925.1 TetR/AcrR family transcriptional regulator [Helicobacter sp. MIT 11-5569]